MGLHSPLLLPTSRVTELSLTVEQLQNQNLEKDRVNTALTEKLDVRCSHHEMWQGRMGVPDPWI